MATAPSPEALTNLTRFDLAARFTPPRRRILWVENALDCRTWTYYCDIRDAMGRWHELCTPAGGSRCVGEGRGFVPDFIVVGPRYTANIAHDDETLGFDRTAWRHVPLVVLQNKMYSATTREIVGDAKAKLMWARELGAAAAFTWLTRHREFTTLSGVPHYWMPFGVDSNLYGAHAGQFGSEAQPYDIGFTGASSVKYPLRDAVLHLIRSMNVSSYLGTWEQTALRVSHNNSWKALDRVGYAAQLSRAKMWVSTTGPSNIVGTRYFEVLASGTTLLLCNSPPKGEWVYDGLFQNGEHVVMFESIEDLRSKILYYARNESARRQIVRQAAQLANSVHSWDARARFLSQVLEISRNTREATINVTTQGPAASFEGCFDVRWLRELQFKEQRKPRRMLRRFTVATCASVCRALPEAKVFALECGGFCAGNGHRLARCWCGSQQPERKSRKRPPGTCAWTCSLHDPRPCGGSGVRAVYSFLSKPGEEVATPVTKAPLKATAKGAVAPSHPSREQGRNNRGRRTTFSRLVTRARGSRARTRTKGRKEKSTKEEGEGEAHVFDPSRFSILPFAENGLFVRAASE